MENVAHNFGNFRIGKISIITNLPHQHLAKHGLKFADKQLDDYLTKPGQTEKEIQANRKYASSYPLYDSIMPEISFEDAVRIVQSSEEFKEMNRGQILNIARAFVVDDAHKLGLETCPEAFMTNNQTGKTRALIDGIAVGIVSTPANGAACFTIRLLQEMIYPSLRGVKFDKTNVLALTEKLRRVDLNKNGIPAHETFHTFQEAAMNGEIEPEHMPSQQTCDAWAQSKKFPHKYLYPFHRLESDARKHGKKYAAGLETIS